MLNKWHILGALIMASSLYAMDEKQALITTKTMSREGCNKRFNNFFNKPICCNSRKATLVTYVGATLTGWTSAGIGIATAAGDIFISDGRVAIPVSLALIVGGAALSSIGLLGTASHARCSQEDDIAKSEPDTV